ncbi:MAG: hypothetical protein JRE47_10125 [Deltaproteobacteria bacterium]|nr:hypothetical protein [Deltaproteobacteria bacterium]
MTPSELKSLTYETEPHFFTRDTMKFFGDTMRNYGVCKTAVDTPTSKNVPVWELYRRKPVKHGLWSSAYFDRKTFKRVYATI